MTEPRRCFYIPVEQSDENGYIPSVVTEGVPGHSPLTGNGDSAAPWYWGKTYQDAKAHAEEQNRLLGITAEAALEILMSSMAARQPLPDQLHEIANADIGFNDPALAAELNAFADRLAARLNVVTPDEPQVDTEVWDADPDRPGYLKFIRRRTVREVWEDLRKITGDNPEGASEYFAMRLGYDAAAEWPEGQTIVWAGTGSNEGHLVSVDVIGEDNKARSVLLGKGFEGWHAAWSLAKRLAKILRV